MNYYKIINDNLIVGVVDNYAMRKYQSKHNVILICGADDAQYAQYKDTLYHDNWMLPVSDNVPYAIAQIISINKDEYDELLEQLAIEDEIIVPNPEPEEEPSQEEELIPTDETNPKTVAQQLQEQINELSSQLALATRYAKL